MKVIGITGGTGSGKSTVSAMLSELGAAVIDADAIATAAVKKGSKALLEIGEYFGSGILTPDGELDRKRLSAIVFKDKIKLNELNRITHKYVIEEIDRQLKRHISEKKATMVAVDVPVPVEHGFLDVVDEVWVVIAPREARLERIMERSGITREEAGNRLDSQLSDEQYRSLADEVIENNTGIDSLRWRIEVLFNKKIKGDAIAKK